MPQRMTTEWDYEKKDYKRVPDFKIERYISICHGSYIFDLNYMIDRIKLSAKWPMADNNGKLTIMQGNIVIEDTDLERIIEVLQERIIVRDKKH